MSKRSSSRNKKRVGLDPEMRYRQSTFHNFLPTLVIRINISFDFPLNFIAIID